MNKTKNDLSAETRQAMTDLLNARLADAVDLLSQTKAAHWNVKGPSFIGLHELFDKVYEYVGEAVDLIAERRVQLGGVALGTVRVAAKASTLKEYPSDIKAGLDHVEALSERLASFGKQTRAAIDTADEAGDADTADMFTDISREIDKWLWFVESHNGASK
ncbi:MAG: DNA starvation/stationary phase protection protein Dps [Tepidisphaeraceae bacterium]